MLDLATGHKFAGHKVSHARLLVRRNFMTVFGLGAEKSLYNRRSSTTHSSEPFRRRSFVL